MAAPREPGQHPVVLAVNAGSSSLKAALFEADGGDLRVLRRGQVARIGSPEGMAWLAGGDLGPVRREAPGRYVDHAAGLQKLLSLLEETGAPQATCIGHRIVHGGTRFVRPTLVDDGVFEALERLVELAPLHLPPSLACLSVLRELAGSTPQVACFDTAFHASMPEVARRLPLPARYLSGGLRRFGFHGLSYEHILAKLGPAVPSRIVAAHLGAGASVTAIRDGRSVDTTMGLSPSGGVVMATRTGDLDPGVVVHMLRHEGLSADALEQVVERQSGLLALGGTSDMQELLARAPREPGAALAVEAFGYGVKKAIAGFFGVLGGLDLLVFTGGIGEHAAQVRTLVCADLEALGIALDPAANARSDEIISSPSSRCVVRIVPADEERVVALHALHLVA